MSQPTATSADHSKPSASSAGILSLLKRLADDWNQFFHAPANPQTCALLRIAFAVVMLIYFGVQGLNLTMWYGESGVLPIAEALKTTSSVRWSVLYWVTSDSWLWICYFLAVSQIALLLLGCCTRLNALCVFVWLVSFQNRNGVMTDSEDIVFRLVGFFLIWIPSGQVYSLDAWWQRRYGSSRWLAAWERWWPLVDQSGFGLRLLQIQMVLIFATAAGWKLLGPVWRDGTALYYVSRLHDLFGRFPVPEFVLTTPWLMKLLTWSALGIEIAVPLLIWWPRTRRLALVLALLFHLANEYTMQLFLFHWIMLVGWISFLQPEDWAWLTPGNAEAPAGNADVPVGSSTSPAITDASP